MFLDKLEKDKLKGYSQSEYWYQDVVARDTLESRRINDVLKIKSYLLRHHQILQRQNYTFKDGKVFETSKVMYNTLSAIIDFHVDYLLHNSVTLNGFKDVVKEYNKLYKMGNYTLADYKIATDLYKYGNAFEYVYKAYDGKIKSKIIKNEDSYPVYDDNCDYVAFVEHWNNVNCGGHDNYIVYTPDKVYKFQDNVLLSEEDNSSGLPIHYKTLSKDEDGIFGDPFPNNIIPIMDDVEELSSRLDDAIYRLSLFPVGISIGQALETGINGNIVGTVINMDDDSDFKWATAMLDSKSIEIAIREKEKQLVINSAMPSVIMGQSNPSNVSETSIQYLYSLADTKAGQTKQALLEGMQQRFDYMRSMLQINGIEFDDEDFYSLEPEFTIHRPVDNSTLLDNLKKQRDMGAISLETILEKSPFVNDTSIELKRLEDEQKNKSNNTDTEVLKDESKDTEDKNS